MLKPFSLKPYMGAQNVPTPSGTQTQMTDLKYFSSDVTVLGRGSFLPNFQPKLKFDKIYIYIDRNSDC